MKIAECHVKDPRCGDSRTPASIAAQELRARRSQQQIRAALRDSDLARTRRAGGYVLRICKMGRGHARPFTIPEQGKERKGQMTRKQNTVKANWKEVMESDEDFMKALVQEVMQQVLEAEMEEALCASKGQRTERRLGYRSGYHGRKLTTRVGTIELRVPQDRQGRFRTEVFERYQRSQKAQVSALTEMYVQGVSTRKVKAITEELCGHEFSAATISRLNQQLDQEFEKFSQRRLEEDYPYLILDARYEKGAGGGRDSQPGRTDRDWGELG
jgi:hypothetical protein